MIGAIAGLATSVIGSALASKKAAEAAQERDRLISEREARISNDRAYERYLDRSQTVTNQALLTQGRELGKQMIERAEGQRALGLGSDATVAAAMQTAASQADNLTKQAMINGEQAAQQAENRYQEQKAGVDKMKMDVQTGKMVEAAKMGSNFADAGTGLIGSDLKSYLDTGRGAFENIFRKKNVKTTGVIEN